jgi:uncharacterized protein YhfF
MSARTPEVQAFWGAFRSSSGLDHDRYDVVAVGDGAEMAEELADLAFRGSKRATACLLRDVESGGESMPVAAEHVVVVDGRGQPRCIWPTTEVAVKPLIEVDESFARDEGEGNRTRDDWLRGHRSYFSRQAARGGFDFHDPIETVFERFIVVWPPAVADQ